MEPPKPPQLCPSPGTSTASASEDPSAAPSGSAKSDFDFTKCCFLCGRSWSQKYGRHLVSIVSKGNTQDQVRSVAESRNDHLGVEVLHRLHGIPSLLEVGARYHRKCHTTFFNYKPHVRKTSPASAERAKSFDAVCRYIEQSGKFEFRLAELKIEMITDSMCDTTLFKKLTAKYGSDIYIHQQRGQEAIVHYKFFDVGDMCGKFYRREDLHEKEKQIILKAAAELLKKDIQRQTYTNDRYPPPTEFLNNIEDDIPETLKFFFDELLCSEHPGDYDRYEVKRSVLAHSIIAAIRQNSFTSTLQLAIGTYVYRKTGSRQIIDRLYKMGVSASYHHLQQYKTSIVTNPPEIEVKPGVYIQHVFDNTDHKVSTSDGHQTFHCLGGIAIYTPESDVSHKAGTTRVRDRSASLSTRIANKDRIPAIPYSCFNTRGLEAVKYRDTSNLGLNTLSLLPLPYSVYVWAKSFGIKKLPSWRGFMEVLSRETPFSVSSVVSLPFINEPPAKPTTLYTALSYARSEADKLKQKTCFVTFDQPLYQKARAIIAESKERGKLKNVVVRLGGFRLLMSYLGAIGRIMSGSGLDSLWSVVYASQSVKHMLSGQAFSRAMRAHILTFTALGIAICDSAKNDKTEEYRIFITSFLDKWHADPPQPPTISDCRADPLINEMTAEFTTQMNCLKNNGPTAQLWLQYFEMVVVALQFVEAERLGNWELHLQCVKEMLPIFHASGNLPYAKSAQLYLQEMMDLEHGPEGMPEEAMERGEYEAFTKDGYFTIRRSDKAWTGVWTDMTIEQTLNRFLETDLKDGRGNSPGVAARYLLTMPSTFSIIESVEELFRVTTSWSPQHTDIDPSRIKRDELDVASFLLWINRHEPFKQRASLVSLSTGIVGGTEINCHLAIEIGKRLMHAMVGQNAKDVSLSISNRVKTLESAKAGLHIGGTSRITVDSELLVQRISVLLDRNLERKKEAFEYELSPFPLALFDEKGFMRRAQTSELYKIFKVHKSPVNTKKFLQDVTFVIDGGFLLHSVHWSHGSTFRNLFETYLQHIVSHYRFNAWVVFDGCNNERIGFKSYERYRREEKNLAADIDIDEDMLVTLTQARFLSNTANRFKFVRLLSGYLRKKGISVTLADEDVDSKIVNTAIEVNRLVDGPVTVVGKDVDLFVLLIGLTNERETMYYYEIVPNAKTRRLYSTADHGHLRNFILFAHAFVGCGTTSALYSKDKRTLFKMMEQKEELRQLCRIFYNPDATPDTLFSAAEKFIFHLYGVGNTNTLGSARFEKFELLTVIRSTTVRLASLPPTAAALKEHAKRVYLQIQMWLGHKLRPEDWGWVRSSIILLPIMTTKAAAPPELLNEVSCSCTSECHSIGCSCQKAGVKCSHFCKACEGVFCENAPLERPDFSDEITEQLITESELLEESDEDEMEGPTK